MQLPLLIREKMNYKALIDLINGKKEKLVIGIDGPCASGKTTLAAKLGELYDINIIHMDDFFLPPELRTEERLSSPGGNIHYERFSDEVVEGLSKGESFSYRCFDCQSASYTKTVTIIPKRITVIEGAYSLHPLFRHIYDTTVFCTVSPEEQIKRILKRNGEIALEAFKTKWIPMENQYFDFYKIPDICKIII